MRIAFLLLALLLLGGLTLAQTTPQPAEKKPGEKAGEKAPEKKPVEYPVATLETQKGVIKIMLFPQDAPLSVENFIQLARSGFYDGLQFHRVVENFVIQGGDPQSRNAAPGAKNLGEGGPGYSIPDELTPNRTHEIGAVGMAKTAAPNSAGSQFYIVVGKPALHLDKLGFTVFGKVIAGQEVAEKISVGDRIKKVTITEPEGGVKSSPVSYRPAMLLSMVVPRLPDIKLAPGEKAAVRMEFSIAPDGTATARIIEGSGNVAVDEAVRAAVLQWRWQPALKEGVPIRTDREMTIELPLAKTGGEPR